jgi:hypothetical protein
MYLTYNHILLYNIKVIHLYFLNKNWENYINFVDESNGVTKKKGMQKWGLS